MESPGRYGDWLAPPPSPPRGSRSQSIRPARGKDFYLATSGDLYLATSRDIFMATDTRPPTPSTACPRSPAILLVQPRSLSRSQKQVSRPPRTPGMHDQVNMRG